MPTRSNSFLHFTLVPNFITPLFTDTHLQAFDSVIRHFGISGYLCGGTVRDLLLKRPFKDVDVVLSDRVFDAAELFAARINSPFFILDRERQIARVVCGPGNWDFSGFRNHTIEGDLSKRDFTINAMAVRWEDFYPAKSPAPVIDPFSGLSDLQNKIIRSVTKESLEEDPLRMLRAFRIEAELNFTIDPAVLEQMETLHSKVGDVATERVAEELDRIFLQPDSARAWRAIGNSSLFGSLFPEMALMKGCDQGGYHHLDVWGHSVAALESFEEFLPRIPQFFSEYAEPIEAYLKDVPGTLDRTRLLKWALVLHDVGKPQTRELKEPGRWRFYGHDHVGADLARPLLKRLKFSRKDAQLISLMIEHHLRPLSLFNQSERNQDHFYKFFRAVGGEAVGVLLIAYADLMAARGPLAEPERDREFLNLIQEMVRYYFEEYYPAIHTPELIKGRDLMVVLQMKPGPAMGELLREIREAQLTGALRSREEALNFAAEWLKNRA